MYKTKQFTLIFNSLHPKTVQSPLIIFWTSGPFKYFLTRRNLTSENITNESEICRSIFCRIVVNFLNSTVCPKTTVVRLQVCEFTKNTIFRIHQGFLVLLSCVSCFNTHPIVAPTATSIEAIQCDIHRNTHFCCGFGNIHMSIFTIISFSCKLTPIRQVRNFDPFQSS